MNNQSSWLTNLYKFFCCRFYKFFKQLFWRHFLQTFSKTTFQQTKIRLKTTEVKPLIYTEIYTSCRLISTRNFVCRQFVWKLSAENFCKNLVWKLSAENFCRNLVWKTCKIRRAFCVYTKNLCRLYTNFLYTDFWWWILLCRAPVALFLHFVSSKWISYIVVT